MISYVRRWRRTPVLVRAGLLVAAAGLFLPGDALAGCSHRVTANAHPLAFGAFSVDRLVAGDLTNGDDVRRDLPEPRLPKSPCGGWRCSGDSIPPRAEPPATERVDVPGCCTNDRIILLRDCSLFPHDDDDAHAVDRVDRLARPPREATRRCAAY